MAVKAPLGIKLNYPYAQTTITPISIGTRLRPSGAKLTYPYAQSSISPITNGSKVKAIPPLPGSSGGTIGY